MKTNIEMTSRLVGFLEQRQLRRACSHLSRPWPHHKLQNIKGWISLWSDKVWAMWVWVIPGFSEQTDEPLELSDRAVPSLPWWWPILSLSPADHGWCLTLKEPPMSPAPSRKFSDPSEGEFAPVKTRKESMLLGCSHHTLHTYVYCSKRSFMQLKSKHYDDTVYHKTMNMYVDVCCTLS